jgi:RNA polymerase sigma-70 factor, ECF subfamily
MKGAFQNTKSKKRYGLWRNLSMEDILIARAQRGDATAFQRLVEIYHEVAWRTARVMVPDYAMAEDAMQEAWFDAWKYLSTFQVGRPFRPWLLTLVANRCRKIVLARSKAPMPIEMIEADGLIDEEALQALLRVEVNSQLTSVLVSLSAEQRQVLELRFFADLELAEIALVIGVSLGTVKSRLHRAIQALRAPSHANVLRLLYVS